MFSVYKNLTKEIECADVDGKYKYNCYKLIRETLQNINTHYENKNCLSTSAYNVLLNDLRNSLLAARNSLTDLDKWAFDYVSFERHIVGTIKQVMWARMNYEDVKKIRSEFRKEI